MHRSECRAIRRPALLSIHPDGLTLEFIKSVPPGCAYFAKSGLESSTSVASQEVQVDDSDFSIQRACLFVPSLILVHACGCRHVMESLNRMSREWPQLEFAGYRLPALDTRSAVYGEYQ